MELALAKKCEWCKKEFTGKRILADPDWNSDDAPCWCSNRCFEDEERHNDEMDTLMRENGSWKDYD